MNTLSELISLLENSELKLFKQYLKQNNKRIDVKNIQLLELIKTDDINGLKKLYGDAKNNDAYHALRKRLQDSLLSFLSQRAFETDHSETHDALRLVVVGRALLEKELNKIAWKCLDKAEKIAERLEQFNLLNELLMLKIQYAHLPEAEPFEALTQRFEQNQQKMQRESRLNIAYAFLRHELKEIHLKGKIVDLKRLMLATLRKYQISIKDLMTYRSVHQILYLANEYAAIQHNYQLIEQLVNRTDKLIQRRNGPERPYLYYQLSILYLLANFHLRRRSFQKSSEYLDQMMELMNTDGRYHTQFILGHRLLSGLNLFFTGFANEATHIMQAALSGSKRRYRPEDVEDIRISVTMFMALRNDRQCLKQLSLLTHSDAWYEKKMGMLWTIRKNLMEILIHAQFSNIELAMSRLNSFKRRYRKYLLSTSEERVIQYLKLVERYLTKPDVIHDPAYKKAVNALLTNAGDHDLFVISFIAWLMARWDKRTAYEIALDVLKEKRH